ncbi:MAG: CHAD domain-containing protein [Chlorobium sp.]
MRTTPKTEYFRLSNAAEVETLLEQILPVGWKLESLEVSKEQKEFYDTFEWQAFDNKIAIVKKQAFLFLVDLITGRETHSVPFQKNCPSFLATSLPSSPLKEKLYSCSNIRAFSKLCTLDTRIYSYHILDDNDKTLAILTAESFCLQRSESQEPFMHLFALSPLRGYEDEIAPISQFLSVQKRSESLMDFREIFLLIMHEARQNIKGYSAKIQLKLNPDATIHESALQLLQHTLSVMRLNENGIKKDIDSEFLHDYRVAIRRTRSIMKQLMGIFLEKESRYFLTLFRELGKKTNDLRDRDVYLLREESYFNSLPPYLQPSLRPFFENIAESRKDFYKRLCRYLSSIDYQLSLNEWETFLNQQSLQNAELTLQGSRSTKIVATESIKKAWKKVIRHGRQISRETTDTELHALRIDCKKLRYLLEFFASIFQPETITPVIRQLKELQENLGAFVDFAVQLRFLHEKLESMASDKLLAASIGGLMATLFQKQEEARLKFHKTFASFDHEETSQLFHDLLTGCSP